MTNLSFFSLKSQAIPPAVSKLMLKNLICLATAARLKSRTELKVDQLN